MKTLANISTKSKRQISRSCYLPDVQFGTHVLVISAGKLAPVSGFPQTLYASCIFATASIMKIRYNNARNTIKLSKLCLLKAG